MNLNKKIEINSRTKKMANALLLIAFFMPLITQIVGGAYVDFIYDAGDPQREAAGLGIIVSGLYNVPLVLASGFMLQLGKSRDVFTAISIGISSLSIVAVIVWSIGFFF